MEMMQMQQMGQVNPMAQPAEVAKVFVGEAENLELCLHEWDLSDVETRILKKFGKVKIGESKKHK